MKVYVVRGSCGEYSDYRMWDVKAFASERAASDFCTGLNLWCIENGVAKDSDYSLKCPLDPNFESDYTGTSYHVWDIEVEDA